VHALTLLAVVLAAAPLAEYVPLAALAGILLFVAWNMGEWREFARLRHFSMPYRTILLGTFLLTVIFDLTVAVEVGLALACVFFISHEHLLGSSPTRRQRRVKCTALRRPLLRRGLEDRGGQRVARRHQAWCSRCIARLMDTSGSMRWNAAARSNASTPACRAM
jgi:hypothetical protein